VSKRARKNLKIAVVGAGGRMGREILSLIEEDTHLKAISVPRRWNMDPMNVDVVIDFSTPEGFREAVKWCQSEGKPLVSGTTGFSDKDKKLMIQASRDIPVLYSANMSLGIAVMSAMLEQFQALEDWDFQIDEVHHNAKKDRPSGTALLLDHRLSDVLGRKLPAPNSIRGGGVPGIHQVWAMGPEEMLVLQHTAFNRKVFARGAIRAARWLFDKQQPGLYDLSDLYKMRS